MVVYAARLRCPDWRMDQASLKMWLVIPGSLLAPLQIIITVFDKGNVVLVSHKERVVC
jgi:hypothetical protein